mmetsp:Transcript_17901/g.51305  ORF Transcript_17901/g.51305 Transcript_17901/m.51305 type:complete len:242 (-) Transcript_17901:547-1272(-)
MKTGPRGRRRCSEGRLGPTVAVRRDGGGRAMGRWHRRRNPPLQPRRRAPSVAAGSGTSTTLSLLAFVQPPAQRRFATRGTAPPDSSGGRPVGAGIRRGGVDRSGGAVPSSRPVATAAGGDRRGHRSRRGRLVGRPGMHPLPLGPVARDAPLGLLHLPPPGILLLLPPQAARHVLRVGPRLPRLALGPAEDGAFHRPLDPPVALGPGGLRLGRQRAAAPPPAAAAEGLSAAARGSIIGTSSA